jgi:hypothetical protein
MQQAAAPAADTSTVSASNSSTGRPPGAFWRAVHRKLLVAGVLTLLTMIGLFLTNYRPADAFWYWAAMFPAFGLISIAHAVTMPRAPGEALQYVILRQLLHWLGPIAGLWLLFLQLQGGQMDRSAVGLMTLLLLAATSYLAGVHLDRGFIWVSALLAVGVLLGTAVQAYLWLIIVVGLIALAVVVAAAMMLRPRREAIDPSSAG